MKKIFVEESPDIYGKTWIVDGELCVRVNLDGDIDTVIPKKGDYLFPSLQEDFPETIYRITGCTPETPLHPQAVAVKDITIIREACIELFYEGFYNNTLINLLAIEEHFNALIGGNS